DRLKRYRIGLFFHHSAQDCKVRCPWAGITNPCAIGIQESAVFQNGTRFVRRPHLILIGTAFAANAGTRKRPARVAATLSCPNAKHEGMRALERQGITSPKPSAWLCRSVLYLDDMLMERIH